MKSMFRMTSIMLLAASVSPLAIAEDNATVTTPSTKTSAAITTLMQGCDDSKDVLELVREGIRDGHEGKTNAMANCPAYTMGFDEGKLHYDLRKTNTSDTNKVKEFLKNKEEKEKEAQKAKDDLKDKIKDDNKDDTHKKCNPALSLNGGGIRVGAFEGKTTISNTTLLKPCPKTKNESWADRLNGKPTPGLGRGSKDSAADRAAERGNTSRASSGQGSKDMSRVDREASKNVASDNAARSAKTGNTNRDRQGTDGRSSSSKSNGGEKASERSGGRW